MDNLPQFLQSTSITEGNVYRDHPRWSDYKNEGKLRDSQRHRRQSHLQRQKKAQEERLDRIRDLCDEAGYGNYEEPRDDASSRASILPACESPNLTANAGRILHTDYVGYLMLGEWLIDVPEDFAEKWRMVPCPEGRRCLVVAKQGITRAYAKNGRILTSFESALPGGSYSIRGSFTMLDCIYMRGYGPVARDRGDRFFVLDVLCWNKYPYMDANHDVRQFIVQSKVEECANERLPFPFFTEPSCACSKEEMTEMMAKDFDFMLDGLLFFYREGSYTPNETPLVGWLKPGMMPKILGVDVPEIYKMRPPADESSMELESCPQPNRPDENSQPADDGGATVASAEKTEGDAGARPGTC